MSAASHRMNVGSLPRSHKFLLKLGNLLQVHNSKTCSSASLASDALASSAIVEDGISVNSLDGSLKRYVSHNHNKHNHNHPYPSPRPGSTNRNPSCQLTSGTGTGSSLITFRRQSYPYTAPYHQTPEADSTVHNNLIFPPEIAELIARDVSEAARYEPYGTRGCVVHVRLQTASGEGRRRTLTLGHVICDPDTVTTFEIELVLREDDQRFLTKLRHLLPRKLFKKTPIIVSRSYSIKKKKLFRGYDNADTTSAEE